jgi:DNA invertase Pin-like site-specific DNA recombinase
VAWGDAGAAVPNPAREPRSPRQPRREALEAGKELDESGVCLDRPTLERAIHRIEVGLSDGLAVWRIDRFARGPAFGACRAQQP